MAGGHSKNLPVTSKSVHSDTTISSYDVIMPYTGKRGYYIATRLYSTLYTDDNIN